MQMRVARRRPKSFQLSQHEMIFPLSPFHVHSGQRAKQPSHKSIEKNESLRIPVRQIKNLKHAAPISGNRKGCALLDDFLVRFSYSCLISLCLES